MTTATQKDSITRMGTMGRFLNRRACSETLFCVLDRAFEYPAQPPARKVEERGCCLLAGGIMARGYQCGALWGSTLNAGAQVYRHCGSGPRAGAQAIITADRLVKSFRERNPSINCSDLTVPNIEQAGASYFFLKGGLVKCLRRTADFAPAAFKAIDSSVQQQLDAAPRGPVSCAALVAEKAGASELHQIMVSGFAGGIGLSGGGCGALGAAIWLISMKALNSGSCGNLWDSKPFRARLEGTMDAFLKCSGYEIECSEIIGRQFVNVSDHAQHLTNGGCARIVETLAAECRS